MTTNKKIKSGFSLIEVIIAFSILTITVLAATNLISSSIQSNQENILRVQAYFLAQEGLELTRAYRDTLWLTGKDFTDLNGNAIEFNSTAPTDFKNDTTLYLDTQNNKFTHQPISNTTSGFLRKISFTNVPNIQKFQDKLIEKKPENLFRNAPNNFSITDPNKSKLVTSEVTYTFNGNDKTIKLQTILTDWKPI